MLDFRYLTFLTLYRLKNYTRTAEELHITQPAVTQHIKYLENYYGCSLFQYSGKILEATSKGKKLFKYVKTMESDAKEVKTIMSAKNCNYIEMNFGVTLSVGASFIAPVMIKVAKEYPNVRVKMVVENTSNLLNNIEQGIMQFAIIQGYFDKSKYNSIPFRDEELVPLCSSSSKLCGKEVSIEQLFDERLIRRENGSGSRNIFENWLYQNNYSIEAFSKQYEIGSIPLIKTLLMSDLGISFLYKNIVQDELDQGKLSIIKLKDFNIRQEFSFVYSKGSIHEDLYKKWYRYINDAI